MHGPFPLDIHRSSETELLFVRRFAAEDWPTLDTSLWNAARQQARDLIGVEGRGQAPGRLRRLNMDSRVRRDHIRLNEKAQELAYGRQPPRETSRARALAMALRGIPTNDVGVERLELQRLARAERVERS